MSDSLARMAGDMKSNQVQLQISVAVMKQLQDQQQAQATALIEMMQQSPTADGTGQMVNIAA